MQFPQWRTLILHALSAAGGAGAAVGFASSHAVDLYAIVDQVNVVVTNIGKLVALVTPFATGAYAAYKASTRSKLIDLAADPEFKGAVASPALAAAVPSEKVVASVAALPAAVK